MSRSVRLGVSVAVALVSALSALLAWGLGAVTDEPTFVVAFVGLLANVVMAASAILAFRLWRAQLRGQTEHAAVVAAMRCVLAADHELQHALFRTISGSRGDGPEVARRAIEKHGLVADNSISTSREELLHHWRELDRAAVDLRVACGPDGSKLVEAFRAHLIAMLTYMVAYVMDTAGIDTNGVPEPQTEWSWRGAFRGDFADAVLLLKHQGELVKAVVNWCEQRLGRPSSSSNELTDDELTMIIRTTIPREAAGEWLAANEARKSKAAAS